MLSFAFIFSLFYQTNRLSFLISVHLWKISTTVAENRVQLAAMMVIMTFDWFFSFFPCWTECFDPTYLCLSHTELSIKFDHVIWSQFELLSGTNRTKIKVNQEEVLLHILEVLLEKLNLREKEVTWNDRYFVLNTCQVLIISDSYCTFSSLFIDNADIQ